MRWWEVGEVSSNTKAKIISVDQKYKSDRLTYNIIGQVKNIGNCHAGFVQINFNLFNKKGELIVTDYTFADPETLIPGRPKLAKLIQIQKLEILGQESLFNQYIDEKTVDKVKAFEDSLTWSNPDGKEDYIKNVDVVEDENNYTVFQENKSNKLTDEDIEELRIFEK